jgi:L-threonate 2-dehydrogenase
VAEQIVVAITAPGGMGSAVGGILRHNGAIVRTSLRGRSAASAQRAQSQGLVIAETDEELVEGADFLLSILPPGEALAIAERLRVPLERAKKKPVYVECNAIAPQTAQRIAEKIQATGCRFVDSGIIGSPPKPGAKRTFFYVSGPDAASVKRLNDYELNVTVVDGPIGAASAMKMSYAGISKGTTAIGTAMILGAARYDTVDALQEQLATSAPDIAEYLANSMPRMYSKAHRFVGEMEELAEFLEGIPGASEMYRGAARLYEYLGQLYGQSDAAEGAEFDALKRFVDGKVKV